jgi:hypothetical protein
MNARDPTPSRELHSREALAAVFAELNNYEATTHFVGPSTIFTLTADRATGETNYLAHHVTFRKWKATFDARLAPISRHVREDGRRVAVCGASAVRRLVGGARTFMTPGNFIASMITFAVPRGRA